MFERSALLPIVDSFRGNSLENALQPLFVDVALENFIGDILSDKVEFDAADQALLALREEH